MDATLFLAADFANKGDQGKINVLGIFNLIRPTSFPYKHRTLYLVIRLVSTLGEFDTEHDVRIMFVDEDGHELGSLGGQVRFERPDAGRQVVADLILEVQDLLLERPGRHEFRLIVNRDLKAVLPIDVVQVSTE